jgi:Protein kinase domain
MVERSELIRCILFMQEFCNGGSLRCALGKGLFGAEQLPSRWDALMSVLRDVAAGMNYMHAKRICHGDLNPSNILLKVHVLSLIVCNCAATPIEPPSTRFQFVKCSTVAISPRAKPRANSTDSEHAV